MSGTDLFGRKPDKKPRCADCDTVLDRLRAWTEKPWRGQESYRQAHARHTEHGVEACLSVIDWCRDGWRRGRHSERYLRPDVLFRKSKFQQRLENIKNGCKPPQGW